MTGFWRGWVGLWLIIGSAWAAPTRLPPGATPPDQVGRTHDGRSILLSDTPQAVRVVSFWATWCAPCRAEMSFLDQVQKQVSPEHLQVIAVNIEDRRTFKRIVAKLGTELGITLTHDGNGAIARRYGVGAIPHTVIIGRDGKIANTHLGFAESRMEDLIAELNALLASGKAP